MRYLIVGLGLMTVFSSGPVNAQTGLQTCAAIKDAAERLFCFDRLAASEARAGQTTTSEPAPPVQPEPTVAKRQAQPDHETAQSRAEALASQDTFGLEMELARQGPEEIQSRYNGYFKGSKGRGHKFELENGQV